MKKKRKESMPSMSPVYKPDHKAERRYSAENMADTMMRTHPKMKAMKNHITREVQKAAHKAMSGQVRRGRFGAY